MELILTLQGGRPPIGISALARFGVEGGSIGRSDSNEWVLRDTERTISARHAAISFDNGRFFVTDTSSNGILYNESRAIGRGNRVQLVTGDRFMIGPYRIIARVTAPDDLGVRPEQAASRLGATPGSGAPARIDPLAGFASGETGGLGIIPEDFDPLSMLGPKPAQANVRVEVQGAPSKPLPLLDDFDLLGTMPEPSAAVVAPAPDVLVPSAVQPVASDAPDVAFAARRIEESRVLPSPDGADIGGMALQPVARRSTPLLVADPAETAAILAFWRGLGLGKAPAGEFGGRMGAVGQSLARLLDRGMGQQWRNAVTAGDAAALDQLAELLEPEPGASAVEPFAARDE